MAQVSVRDVIELVDQEGFDYFFRHYIPIKDLPDHLQEAAQEYVEAADKLEKLAGLK
jgi:hypothetical protein